MSEAEREALLSAIRSLMVADNFGDVHDALNGLHRLAELPEPEGDYLDGWTEDDKARAGFATEGD